MATYYWLGSTLGSTGFEWGYTANWKLDSQGTILASSLPFGGDLVIFGATAKSNLLSGGLSGEFWEGYTGLGSSFWTGDITFIVEPRFGENISGSVPQNVPLSFGYSFGSPTGGLKLKINKLYIGTTYVANICIHNTPSSPYSFAHMAGISGTFYASGNWTNVLVEKGSFKGQNLTAKLVMINGNEPTRTERTYFFGTPGVTYAGFGIDEIRIDEPSDIDSVVFSAKATAKQAEINCLTKSPIINAMGLTGLGFTYTSVLQNIRPAGFEKQFNRITRTSRYYRG